MIFNYTIEPPYNLIRLTCSGEIDSIEEITNHMQRVNADPHFKKGMNTLADLSEARLPPSFTGVSQLNDFLEVFKFFRGKCKWAIYAYDKKTVDAVNLYIGMSQNNLIETRLFNSIAEAELWLGLGSEVETK